MILNIIDTHAHLDQIENIDAALDRAAQVGIEAVIAAGVDYQSSIKILDISKKITVLKVYAALGFHPGEIEKLPQGEILQLIEDNKDYIVAVGEIGLDYWYRFVKKDKTKREAQKDIFIKQLSLAKKINLPVVIHSRGAWKDCFEMCKQSGIEKAVFHWYSGPLEILKEIINSGYLISATPSLYYSPQHQDAVKSIPLDRLLVETDSPVFFRDDQGGFRAEPKDVLKTIKLVAELKSKREDVVASVTRNTAKNFFNFN